MGEDKWIDLSKVKKPVYDEETDEKIEEKVVQKSTEVMVTTSVEELMITSVEGSVTTSVEESVKRKRGWNLDSAIRSKGGRNSAEARKLMSTKERSDHGRLMVQARWKKWREKHAQNTTT